MLELDRDVLERARGRWLDFEVQVTRLRARVTLRTTATEKAAWQAVEAEFECPPGHHRLCFFVGDGISSATLEADGEWSVDWKRAEPVASPHRDARVPPGMEVVAWLHSAGLSEMHRIELTGDRDWPFAATGVDPRLRFSAPPTPGLCRVELELESEQGEHEPALYWDTGRGFGTDQARAFRRVHGGRFVVECAVEPIWKSWGFDPRAAPGRFRIGTLSMTPIARLSSSGSTERWGAHISRSVRLLRDRVLGAYSAGDLVLDDGAFSPIAGGDRPHLVADATRLRLPNPLKPGWYMLELCVDFEGARAEAHAYLEAEQGKRTLLPLPLRSGQLVKRLIHVEQPAILRLLPVAAPRAFELRHFKLARLPERFARSRIERKLSTKHPRYMRQTTHGTTGKDVPNDALALFTEYNRLFERSSELISYDEWIEAVERPACPSPREQAVALAAWEYRPTISIIMPIADTSESSLRECLDSVLSQTYPHWELCIADNTARAANVGPSRQSAADASATARRILSDYAARDPRIRLDTALSLAQGDYVTFLDPTDILAPHALFSVARALQQRPSAELVYSDEDKLDERGTRCDPYFKPDYAPDLLYAQNYIAHLAVYRRPLVDAAGGIRPGYEGCQDYDLLLRCIGRIGDARDILHVPEVLCHCRKIAGSSATSHQNGRHADESARRALEAHFHLAHPEVRVSVTAPGLYRVHWPLPAPAPLVTLIVPTRDGHDVLKKCVDSIRQRTTYPNYEILIVDNGSRCLKTRSYLDTFAEQGIRVLRYDAPFNFSAINNFAVREARGSVLGLINDDVEVINDGWLTELVSHALRPEIGCVGAKLYYPDDTIQHAGVVLGIGGVAGHSHRYLDRKHDGYFGRLRIAHNVSAVTAAALVVRRQIWEEVGGLDEAELSVAFNDVDFCLRVMAAGYRNLWTPHAELYHHESKSRGSDETPEKAARFRGEREVMLRRWGPLLERDPYYSPHLSLVREDFSRALPEASHVSKWGKGGA